MSIPMTCRSCNAADGRLILDLGVQPLANNLLQPADLGKPEPKFPLRLFVCPRCWLLQIADDVPPVQLFSEYLYFSSFSETMLRHARQAALRYITDFSLDAKSLVIEIASNDGYLLKNFAENRVPCLGIEPAANIAKVAREKGIETWVEFFGKSLARQLQAQGRAADLVLGNNVFAHAPNTNDFVAGLATVLKPNGRIILEFPYAVDFIEQREFDTIYHEHVFYFTLTALKPLFSRHGLDIYRVERLPIHGGSLRLFAARRGDFPSEASITETLAAEQRCGISQLEYYLDFAGRVQSLKQQLNALVLQLKGQGKTIAAYGASAKGSTLLNFFGLGKAQIDFIVDRSIYKQGRLSPGMLIPILPPEELLARKPDYTLLLTWNFAEEILRQQAAYRAAGGKFIIPIPEVSVV